MSLSMASVTELALGIWGLFFPEVQLALFHTRVSSKCRPLAFEQALHLLQTFLDV